MTERWRCFIAVPLPDGVRSELTDVVDSWRDEPHAPDLRWLSRHSSGIAYRTEIYQILGRMGATAA